MIGVIREYKTARFTVQLVAEPEHDWDFSYYAPGVAEEVAEKLDNGTWVGFCAVCRVYLDGFEIAADYLGQCVYDSLSDFWENSGYAQEMVREAIGHARQYIRTAPALPYVRGVTR